MSWMSKKQTAVSHSLTESEIISLDTGLILEGLLALELWVLIVFFEASLRFHICPETSKISREDQCDGKY